MPFIVIYFAAIFARINSVHTKYVAISSFSLSLSLFPSFFLSLHPLALLLTKHVYVYCWSQGVLVVYSVYYVWDRFLSCVAVLTTQIDSFAYEPLPLNGFYPKKKASRPALWKVLENNVSVLFHIAVSPATGLLAQTACIVAFIK